MAKVHKARKSNTKYSFQKKHLSVKTWLIILAVVVVACVGIKLWYDSYIYGEFDVAAPNNEQLNTIAANWEKMSQDQEAFLNYYQLMGASENGVYNGQVYLLYSGNEAYSVELAVNETQVESTEDPTVVGEYARTTLTDAINGVAPWGQKTCYVTVMNENMSMLISASNKNLTTDDLNAVLAELEARATAPVIEEPVEETTEAEAPETEETPAE